MMDVTAGKEACRFNGLIFSIGLGLYDIFLLLFMLTIINPPKTVPIPKISLKNESKLCG